ncbi:MAG: dihydrodipicolinate synthase family protein [Kiritimatiellae bacterium]|nr:dihydrodipicolinate synthase family protein [Kiritimatiellia bacterium]
MVGGVLLAAALCGPFPLLFTPYTEKGDVDYATLAKEAVFVADCGVNGIIWPPADDSLRLLSAEEERRGLEAIAVALDGRDVWFCPCCPGTNTADAVRRVKTAERVSAAHPLLPATMLVRMADDAKDDDGYRRHYEAVAEAAKHPVIIQTYNGASKPPSVKLMVELSKRHPLTYGWFKVEGSGLEISDMMAGLIAAKPAVKTVFTGWGGRDFLYQYRIIGSRGVITQRPMFADIVVSLWKALESGSPAADDVFAKFMYLANLDNVMPSSRMRGWNLYVMKRRGVFPNTLSRIPQKGGGWKVEDVTLTPRQIAEIEARLGFAGVRLP